MLLVNGYKHLITLALPSLTHPLLLESICQHLLAAVRDAELCLDACGIFQYLYNNVKGILGEDTTSWLALILPALGQTAIEYARKRNNICQAAVSSLFDDILRSERAAGHEEAVRLAMLQVDDRDGVLTSSTSPYLQVSESTDAKIILAAMDMTGLSSSAQAAKLKYLRRILHSSALTAKIINFPKDLENVVLNLHQILRISEPQDTIAINAAHCVGLLTPLIGFHHSKLTSAGHTANSTESLPSENGHTMVLRYLKHCLFDEDMTRVGIAIRTLRHVLCTRAGISAFDNLDPNVAKYIDLFRGKLLQRPKFMGTSLSYPPLTDKLVWELSADKVAEDGAQQVYYQWLSRLANSLLASYPTDEFYPNLGSMCEVYPHFVETIFSRMVMCALTIETTTYEKTTNSNENSLPLRSLLSTQFTSILKNTKADKRIIHFILNTIEFLREEDYPLGSNPFQNNFWLEIDFQAAAVAAVRISRFASALMYLEIADTTFNFQNRTPGNSLDKVERSPTRSELICTIYKSVDIHDGLEGAIAAIDSDTILAEDGFLIQKYMYEGSWEKVYRLQDARLQTTRRIPDSLQIAEMESTLMQSLSKLGLHHVLQNYALGSRHYETSQFKTDAYAKEVQFECYVRTMQWDLPVDSKLLALREGQLQVISPTIQLAFGRQLLREKIQDGDNMATSAFSGTSLLTILSEIEELSIVAINGSPDMFQDLIQRWNTRLDAAHLRLGFTEVEPLLALRSSSLACLIDYCQLTDTTTNFQVGVLKAQCEHLLRYSRLARKAGNVQQAFTSNAHLEVLLSSSAAQTVASVRDYFVPLSKLEQSKNNWVDTDKTVAIKSLKYYLRRGTHHEEDALSKPMESTYLTHIGKWVSESRLESPASVLQDYFEPAVQSSALTNDGKLRAKAHYHLARFADAQYQDLLANDLQEEIREHIRYKQSEADACEALAKQNASRDPNIVKRYVHIRDKMLLQIKMDEAEQNRYLKDRTMFLEKAIENYMESLEYGYVQADVAVFRLCALWLANLEVKSVNSIFRTYINRIPTRKFLVLMYQLSARLTNTPHPAELEFQKTLQLLITLVVKDHPHHTLYQIIALKNGTQLGAPSAQKNKSVPQNPTSTSAATVLDRLRRPEALGDLVLRVETLCDAYIDLAWKGITPAMLKTTKTFPLSRRSPIGQIAVQGLDVPVITADHPVRGDCKYDDLPRITGFKNTFTVPGGINVPKVVECYATDGKTYTQLVKGNDDLRQDAVLSKIFSIMNTLLSKDPNTRKRNLSIRTYKVVPLAPRAGLVEWVHNTLPIGEYLTKAHTTYNPNDWRPTQCRTKMSEEMKKGTRQSRLQIYREVERHFNPVFRHFFFEKFLRPKDWLDRKLAYTRSVATSSIAGYIVGLGDRHAQNILIDAKSAEVVHIDLGIAFDQGKLLTVPELVPFRLTRDMVDGMGITGLEGAFRRSCEESLRVFREDAEMLMTILDVFRYDPLYNWKVTPLEQRRRQGDLEELQEGLTSDPAFQKANPAVRGPNKEAERALFVVKKKLSTDVSVECRINALISSAIDANNLSRMFPGWQPW
ncbi:hypothetical protein DFS34DRAFT_584387 [Phlyctochytrium arcticum]|nr:hypothetical protein DFS34DRAFT_584387 [Phlyctochytrium arcticum]